MRPRICRITAWGRAHLRMTGASATLAMTHTPPHASETHNPTGPQDVAIHMIAAAARILLMLGTAILIGEVATGPARKLLEHRGRNHAEAKTD